MVNFGMNLTNNTHHIHNFLHYTHYDNPSQAEKQHRWVQIYLSNLQH